MQRVTIVACNFNNIVAACNFNNIEFLYAVCNEQFYLKNVT